MQEVQEEQEEQEVQEVLEEQRRLKGRLVTFLQTFKQTQRHLSDCSKRCCECLRVCVVAGSYSSARKLYLCSRTPENSMAAALLC